jgi:DAK2 domain fusion protein YloV
MTVTPTTGGPVDRPPAAVDRLAAEDVRRWAADALAERGRAREEIDALNVFPVADSDTGTNLYLTMEAAAQAADALGPEADAATCVQAVVRGAMLGAWGNSGAILSQMLRGAGRALLAPVEPEATAAEIVVRALRAATELAYAAVDRPTEGTMLTVARAAADAASGSTVAEVLQSAATSAARALELTPLQLDVLARAGVVDAGGRGLTVLLDVLAARASGLTRMSPPARSRLRVPALPTQHCSVGTNTAYELMFLFEGDDGAAARLRGDLADTGDSLVVVGGEGLWNVHLHTDDCGAALEAAMQSGRPYRIRITNILERPEHGGDRVAPGRAVVALASGPGLAKLLDEAGAVVLEVAPGAVPATAALLDTVRRPRVGEVVLLPNDAASRAACEAVATQARAVGIAVAVLPTEASVQALAALAVHEPGRRFGDDVVAMTSAAVATRHGSVLIAPTEAMTSAGVCRAGDALGLIDGDVVLIGSDAEAVGAEVVDRLLGGGGELVTLISGVGLPGDAISRLSADLHRRRPDVECIAYDGGQPDYPLLIGVE